MLSLFIVLCLFGTQSMFFLFTFLLIEIIRSNRSMRTVFYAINLKRDQFILLFMFLGCVILILTYFAYYFVSETFWYANANGKQGENVCVSVWQCFLTILSLVCLEGSQVFRQYRGRHRKAELRAG